MRRCDCYYRRGRELRGHGLRDSEMGFGTIDMLLILIGVGGLGLAAYAATRKA